MGRTSDPRNAFRRDYSALNAPSHINRHGAHLRPLGPSPNRHGAGLRSWAPHSEEIQSAKGAFSYQPGVKPRVLVQDWLPRAVGPLHRSMPQLISARPARFPARSAGRRWDRPRSRPGACWQCAPGNQRARCAPRRFEPQKAGSPDPSPYNYGQAGRAMARDHPRSARTGSRWAHTSAAPAGRGRESGGRLDTCTCCPARPRRR